MAKNSDDIPATYAPTKETPKPDDMEARIVAEVEKRMAAIMAKGPKSRESTEDLDERIAKVVAKALDPVLGKMGSQIGNAIMAAQAATAMTEHDKNMAARKAKLALEEQCHFCRQVVGDGRGRGCGGPWARDPKTMAFLMQPVLDDNKELVLDNDGKPVMRRIENPEQFHVRMEVWPSDPLAAKWFFGVGVNKAWYRSNGPGHKVWVPKVNDLPSLIGVYSTNEVEQRVGREHIRTDGGSISGKNMRHSGPGVGAGFTS